MKLGVWAPLPHTIGREAEIDLALEELGQPGRGLPVDRSYAFVRDVVKRAETIGFDITLVAERLIARDLEAWVVASALAVETSRIEIMTAVHPGIFPPQLVAKMASSLDRLSGGRACLLTWCRAAGLTSSPFMATTAGSTNRKRVTGASTSFYRL